ncbi:hypothetical protein OG252_52205 (plasmid) [Streptomyces sp. NBC_01352]|nr:hypothetical protein [Streptomyces sp. NBC_01352]
MSAEQQAEAARVAAEQARQAEEQRQQMAQELIRHGQAAAAVAQIGARG